MTTFVSGIVEYCVNNVDDETRALLLNAGLLAGESSCLQRCGSCYAGPFLVVDGEMIEGATHRELLRQVLPCSALTDVVDGCTGGPA